MFLVGKRGVDNFAGQWTKQSYSAHQPYVDYGRRKITLLLDKKHGTSSLQQNKKTAGGEQFHCDLCLSRFTNKYLLQKHQELCEGVNGRMRIEMPETGSTLKFENWQRRQKVPYVIYAAFESIIEKLPEDRREKTEKTEKTARHVASVHGCAFGWKKLVKKVPTGC